MNRLYLFILSIFLTASLVAQQLYPVRTITTVTPPYPTSLEQYASIDGGQISLTIIPNDASLQNYPIRLRLMINGGYYKIYSNPAFIHKSITLNNGENLTFSGAELAEWFKPENLIFEGFTKNQYQKTGRLPEGMYQIWFEVYDFYRDINISGPLKEIKATVWTFENDPPLLNLPIKETELSPTDPQNIVFNWTQRQSPFSVAGLSNQYKFELWEIIPDNMNVEEAVRTTRPIYSGDVLTTTFNYTADQPILFTGKKYAWRVQVYDPSGKNRYKNDGYSEVRWFRFGKDCSTPAPTLDKAYFTAIGLKWDNDIRFSKYELRYKNKDIANSNWYTKDATGQSATIERLTQNTTYYVQMRGTCGTQEGEYSPSITVHTRQDASFACGGTPGAIDSADNVPLAALKKGELFRAWDFDIEVFSATGSNGTFSGKGFALVPLLKSIRFIVEFNGITINDKRRMTQGEVKFLYDEKNGLVFSLNSVINAIIGDRTESNPYKDLADKRIEMDEPITGISVSASGDVSVTDEGGNTQTVRASAASSDMVFVGNSDENAEQSVVDTKGHTIYSGTPETSRNGSGANGLGTAAIKQPVGNQSVKYAVTFMPHTLTMLGGMDMPGATTPIGNYNTATIGGTQMPIPWKSVESGKIDRLVAMVDGPADSIHFITKNENMVMTAQGDKSSISSKGSDVQLLKNSGTFEHLNTSTFEQLLVTGVDANDELKAWYPEYERVNDTTTQQNRILAGQVNVVAYDKIELNVCMVEVDGAAAPDPMPVADMLNKIYAPALVKWNVTRVRNFTPTLTTLINGKFNNDHSGAMQYNDCEDEVIDAFKDRDDYNRNTLYLFFIGGEKTPTTKKDTKGYMQFDRNFGFIYRDNQDPDELMRTMAHELGHGAFRLKHTFSDECPFKQPQGSTYNLMDDVSRDKATTAIQLHKYQWDVIRKWSLGINWFEKGSEGEIAVGCPCVFTHSYDVCPKTSITCSGYVSPFLVPYEASWKKGSCIPTYFIEYDKGVRDDDVGSEVQKVYPALIKLNSPITLKGYKELQSKEPRQVDGIYISKTFLISNVDFPCYEGKVLQWKQKHWSASNDLSIQATENVEILAKAILKNGELDPRKCCSLSKDGLYEVEYLSQDQRKKDLIYYSEDEIICWLWGYIAYRHLNFSDVKSTIAFGIQYFDKKDYSVPIGVIEELPWKVKAIEEGWMYGAKTYFDNRESYPMDKVYKINAGYVPQGTSKEDLMELTLWVYTGAAASVEKITVQVATKAIYKALVDWSIQVGINMIGGDNFETAAKKVKYGSLIYSRLSSLITNEPAKMTFSCLKTIADNALRYKELKLEKSLGKCFVDILTDKIVKSTFEDKNGPYYILLDKVLKNKSAQQIVNSLKGMGFTNDKIKEFSSILPSTLAKDILKLLGI